jgi:2,3-bisphosphoglycerate-independent phosphoglycerate mutase
MNRMIFVFLDGVGIGEASESNPFWTAGAHFLPFFKGNRSLPDGTPVKPIDPLLGVEGMPQSATGQTTLYTGENVPALLNEHVGSYPNRMMRKVIRERNILSKLRDRGLNAGFINAYPFHSRLFSDVHVMIEADGGLQFSDHFPAHYMRRLSVTTCMMIVNGLVPFDETDIAAERAIYQEYTNVTLVNQVEAAKKAGKFPEDGAEIQLPIFAPEKAAEILYRAAGNYDFLLYEYFQTDIYGHRSSYEEQVRLIRDLGRFIQTLVSLLDREHDTLLITSDHGNLEDSSTRAHTFNPVPLVIRGKGEGELRNSIDSLVDVTPAVLRFFGPTEYTEDTENREKKILCHSV